MAPDHGRLLGGEPCEACVDVLYGAAAPGAVDDLDLGRAHELAVNQLDVLGRQELDAIGELQDQCICLASPCIYRASFIRGTAHVPRRDRATY